MSAFRPLTLDDLPAALALAESRSWPREDRKWAFLLRVGQGYGLTAPDGSLAAAAILTRHDGVAAISMVLVAPDAGRQGLATRLMSHLIERAEDDVVTLYATAMGQPVYERLGFAATGVATTMVGRFTGAPAGVTRPATPDDLGAILAADKRAFGADRTPVIGRVFDIATRVVVAPDAYAATWQSGGEPTWEIVGPVVAPDEHAAKAVISDLAAASAHPIRLDLDRPTMIEWAAANGLTPRFACATMVLGGRPLPGDRDRLFLPFMQALG